MGRKIMSEMDNMTDEKRRALELEAGTAADKMWEAKKRGEYHPTLSESLLEWENDHRMEHW